MAKTLPSLLISLLVIVSVVPGCGKKPQTDSADTIQLIADLEKTEPKARVNAAIRLGHSRDPAAVEPLIKCLGDIRTDVKKAVIEALAIIADPRASQPLGAFLGKAGTDTELQRLAADALGKIGGQGGVPALIQALGSEDEGVVYAAAHSLGQIGGDAALNALANAVKAEQQHLRRAAASALGEIPGERTREIMHRLITSPDSSIRLSAAESLVKWGDKGKLAEIVAMLLDPNLTVRKAMPRLINRLGPECVPHLAAVLKERGHSVKRDDGTGKMVDVPTQGAHQVALRKLCRYSGKQVIKPLLLTVRDSRGNINQTAYAHLVKQMQFKDCRKTFLDMASKGSVQDQNLAISLLSEFFRSKLGGKIMAPNRKELAAKGGLGDVEDFVEAVARMIKSPDAALSFRASLMLCTFGDRRGRPAAIAPVKKHLPGILERGKKGAAADKLAVKAWLEELKKKGIKDLKAYNKLPRNDRKKHRRQGGWGGVGGEDVEAVKRSLDALSGVADKELADMLVPLLSTSFKWGRNWEHILSRAAGIMATVGDPSYKDPLLKIMKEAAAVEPRGPTGIGCAVARALGTLGEKRAFDHIVKFVNKMHHDQYHVWARTSCYTGLLGCDKERAHKAIGDILMACQPKNASGIENIVKFFEQHPGKDAVLPLVFWVNHDIRVEQEKVRDALIKIGTVDMDWLIEGFRVEEHKKRSSLAGVICDGFGAKAIPKMLESAKSDDDRIRQGAAWALGCIGGEEAVETVKQALKDKHVGVRSAAAWSAGNLADPSLVQPMIDTLQDSEMTVRAMAAEQLGKFGGELVIAALIKALSDDAPEVRGYATTSLAALTATEAIPALQALENDTNAIVREAVDYALRKMKIDTDDED
ncbi:HEAT repeat domain-containing protein, partial [Verrucomicrobiota bacterium]